MAKNYLEKSTHPFSPHFNGRMTVPQQNMGELCTYTSHNQPDWVPYMDEPELSCLMGLDSNGPKITFSTGGYTEIDGSDACSRIAVNKKDQRACVKLLNRGVFGGINSTDGEATIYLNANGRVQFSKDGLLTEAAEYEVMDLVDAVANATYTQSAPISVGMNIERSLEQNPIIGDIGLGVMAISLITTVIHTMYYKVRMARAKKHWQKVDLSPIPLRFPEKKHTQTHASPIAPPETDYFFPEVPKHAKNHQPLDE